jgi:hypothetical protein
MSARKAVARALAGNALTENSLAEVREYWLGQADIAIAAYESERGLAEVWAAAWHGEIQSIASILGLGEPDSGQTFTAVRDLSARLKEVEQNRDAAQAENTRRRLGASLRAEEAEAAEAALAELQTRAREMACDVLDVADVPSASIARKVARAFLAEIEKEPT